MAEKLQVIEVFKSIQGETTRAGLPCAFIRLAGCNLRCAYCDTRYAVEEPGTAEEVSDAAQKLHAFHTRLVCITGGEPLLQARVVPLARRLVELGHTVLVETNGTLDISVLPPEALRIMDVKCPGSGECGSTLVSNLAALRMQDEVKFVLCDRRDFDWAVEFAARHGLTGRCRVLFAPVAGKLPARELAGWVLESGLQVRLQVQLHKIIWPERTRGV